MPCPFSYVDRAEPVRHGAHAQEPCVLRLLPRGSERSGAVAQNTRKSAGSRRPQLARRTAAARRKREASRRCSALLRWADQPKRARHSVSARNKPACCAYSQEAASAVARSRVPRESRLVLGGRNWHVSPRPWAEGEKPFACAVPFFVRGPSGTSATRRARARTSRAALPP